MRRATPSVNESIVKSSEVNWDSSLKFRKENRNGEWEGSAPATWQVRHSKKAFHLRPTPAGQLGLFPEQAENWSWIESQNLTGMTAINLFAYTGGTTLALASQGASVVHVDAARNVVGWARENAEVSEMGNLPVRWIVEDALKFVKREVKRGSKYNIVVADPPSFGTGPKNERWKFEQHFEELLSGLAELSSELQMLIISCHTTGFGLDKLRSCVLSHFDLEIGSCEGFPMELESSVGERLNCGVCLRYAQD